MSTPDYLLHIAKATVNALKASLLAFPTAFAFSYVRWHYNGMMNEADPDPDNNRDGTGLQLRDSP